MSPGGRDIHPICMALVASRLSGTNMVSSVHWDPRTERLSSPFVGDLAPYTWEGPPAPHLRPG